jgi:hypothetical protein
LKEFEQLAKAALGADDGVALNAEAQPELEAATDLEGDAPEPAADDSAEAASESADKAGTGS